MNDDCKGPCGRISDIYKNTFIIKVFFLKYRNGMSDKIMGHKRERKKNEVVIMSRLSHFDDEGYAIMVDGSCKEVTVRTAVAKGRIRINSLVMEAVTEHRLEKGDVLGVARVAGIIATKQRVEEKNEI